MITGLPGWVIAVSIFVMATDAMSQDGLSEDCALGERYFQLAQDSLADNDEQQAAVRLMRASSACSRFEYYMALGRLLMDSLLADDKATAVDVFISAHDIAQSDQQRAQALFAYASLLTREGDLRHALGIVGSARKLDPADPEIQRLEEEIKGIHALPGPSKTIPFRASDETPYRPLTGDGEIHSANFNAYHWPPEEASWHVRIDQDLSPPFRPETNLFEVEHRLSRALRDSYPMTGLYSAPNGFVLVTRLEATDADGVPLEGGERFRLPDGERDFELTEYIRSLFFAPVGYYRFIAFVVSDQFEGTAESALSEDEALRRLRRGALRLPLEYKHMKFTENHRIDALIYEFRKSEHDQDVEPLLPGRIPAEQHFRNSGIYVALFE